MKYKFDISRLAIIREAKGFTQQDIADKMAITKQRYSKWETGNLPTIRNFLKICHVLEVKPTIFFVDGDIHSGKKHTVSAGEGK